MDICTRSQRKRISIGTLLICVTRVIVPDGHFDVFFDLRLNKQLNKQSWGWWFETPSRSLWRHYNEINFCRNCMKSSWHGNIFRITGLYRFHDVRRNDFIVITFLSKAVISAPDQRNIYNHNTRHKWLFGEYVADKHYIPTCLHWLIYLATLWSPANQTPSV